MKTKRLLITSLIATQALAAGCTGIASISSSDTLTVTSNPDGASVFIMDKKIGETPLEISQSTIYPNTYSPDKEGLYGVVTLKKAGCNDFSRRIGYRELIKNINADMECGDIDRQAPEVPAQTGQSQTPIENKVVPEPAQTVNYDPVNASRARNAKNRLIELNQLKTDGLITDEEFDTIRQRILDSL